MHKNIHKTIRSKPATTPRFRGVPHAVDQVLKTMNRRSRDYAVLKFLREDAVGPENAKCWREIQQHLRKLGLGEYRQAEFQTGFLQHSREQNFFIASHHKGYYLPGKPEDFGPYLSTSSKRIRGQQTNQRAALRLGKLQEEWKTSRKTAAAKLPAATESPRKARSKNR